MLAEPIRLALFAGTQDFQCILRFRLQKWQVHSFTQVGNVDFEDRRVAREDPPQMAPLTTRSLLAAL